MSVRPSASPHPGRPIDPSSTDQPPNPVHFGPGVPPVRRSPTALARRFYQMCMGMQAEVLANADLTSLQYGVMAILNRRYGEPGIDQNSLAARLGVERSHASLLVEEMAAKGLIERRVNGADRRARLLALTPKAEKLHGRLRPSVTAANDRILEPLSPHERKLFIEMLIRMIGANGAHARPGAGRRKRSPSRSPAGRGQASRKSVDTNRGTS
jgi:DNA-binding MarR family transcriptional regulator